MWIVRDAQGRVMHRGRTRAEALAPYDGEAAKRLRDGTTRLLERGAWRVLRQKGWTCTPDHGEEAAA